MAIPSFSSTVVARAAAALYGAQLGNGTMSAVLLEANATGGVEKLINSVYNRDYAAMSNTDVATMVVSNLGITGAGVANAVAYLKAKIDAAGAANEGAAIATEVANFAGLTGDATYGAAATSFNNRISAAVSYAQQAGTADRAFGAGATLALTMGQDFLTGTSGNDTIVARIFDNQNTLQSGDWVDGGAGTDRLEADMGASQSFSVTPETTGVETFSVRGQSRAYDSGDNNVSTEGRVNVDAQRMSGVTRFDSTDSRADVIIEDIRTALRTKDITIGMIGTDAGNVDYAVYFDKLRADGTSIATLAIELMDTRAATSADAAVNVLPLKDSPYNGFSFKLNGNTIQLRDATPNSTDVTTFNGAQTYPQLLAAIQKMLTDPANLAKYPDLKAITASLGDTFEARDTKSGDVAVGTKIVLSGSSSTAVTLAVGNFIADDGVPADSGLHTVQSTATSSSTDLITSTVVLDNVGRGYNGGDLVIGSMSVGTDETDTRDGIAKFDITVEATSNLGIIASTNNALKEVVIQNGTVKGNLSVKGFDNTTSLVAGTESGVSGSANGSAGSGGTGSANGAVNQHNAYGFNDVRLINASAMTGSVSFDARISASSFAKYMQLSDTQSDPKGDNNSTDGKTTLQVADFDYAGGAGNDTIAVVIDDAIAASNSTVQVGREDFTFTVAGNGGNDTISVLVGAVTRTSQDNTTYLAGGDANWYGHQKLNANISINAGDGDDTVRKPGSGDVKIDLGAGNDTLYSDNTGDLDTANTIITNSGRAVYVFNTTDQTGAIAAGSARNLSDMESDNNDGWFMYKATLTVTFRGIETQSAVTIGSSATTYKTSDLYINQAIKAAINNDPVLKKLLLAEDGPANSLVVKALSDGERVEGDLSFDIVLPDDLSTADANAVGKAWTTTTTALTETEILALMSDERDNFFAADDYVTAMANDGAIAVDGTESTGTTTDNTITGGTGNDIIVLSTTEGVDDVNSSNEVLVYSAAFGDDTIVNFNVGGNGEDQLDFTGMGGDGAALDNDTGFDVPADPDDGDIFIRELSEDDNDTADLVAGLFTDDATDDETYIYVAVDSHNIGHVWKVVDKEGTGDATATLMGTIDLADTDWGSLTTASFVGA